MKRLEGDDHPKEHLLIMGWELYTDSSFCHHRKLGANERAFETDFLPLLTVFVA
jgi:hypothetical protein